MRPDALIVRGGSEPSSSEPAQPPSPVDAERAADHITRLLTP